MVIFFNQILQLTMCPCLQKNARMVIVIVTLSTTHTHAVEYLVVCLIQYN